jgi:CheY-like chemotaxis protein
MSEAVPEARAGQPRALVADDDPGMLEAVAGAMVYLGYAVVRAGRGAELVDALAGQRPFDLIVTDISMPWMDGLKTVRTMRTAGMATPVVVMTALRDQQIPSQVQALGANAVLLRKPFDLDALESAVARVAA